jgi:hypothetical protein
MRYLAACGVLLFIACGSVHGQESAAPAPTKEHEWLKQFVGEWETAAEADLGPGSPPLKCTGEERFRTIGGFWVVGELKSLVSGTEMMGVLTLGYDEKQKRYTGSWVDSSGSYLWKYSGSLDPTGKILTLEAEGPNPMLPGKICKYRDMHEIKSKDDRTSTSQMLSDDGKWVTFMTGTSKRKK